MDHAPELNVDVVSNDKVVGFHREIIVPLGTGDDQNKLLSVLFGDASKGLENRLSPGPKL